ncbi:MAG: hypothetical protein EXX96DRAFT_549126 [Benjaminiella poitrasii]|nr:MAG: hypothetical protein EXX96DRAFT_549126 [Benjaminiella poitrasii]
MRKPKKRRYCLLTYLPDHYLLFLCTVAILKSGEIFSFFSYSMKFLKKFFLILIIILFFLPKQRFNLTFTRYTDVVLRKDLLIQSLSLVLL